MNQAATTQAEFSYIRMQVLFLTKMTDDDFMTFRIDTASAWVNKYAAVIDPAELQNTTIFWQWWNFNWSNMDDKSILKRLYDAPAAQRLMKYRELHQYVFDPSNAYAEWLQSDFNNMLSSFKSEIKHNQKSA